MKKLLVIFLLIAAGVAVVIGFTHKSSYTNFIKSHFTQFGERLQHKMDNPDQAAFRDFIQTVDPETRNVPVERLYEAQKEISANQYRTAVKNQWTQIPTNMGGRTRVLAWDPNDTDTSKVWAGSVSGGLWYNENIHDVSSSWMPANDFWPSLSVSSIAFDPNNTEIMYVGTGEAETAVITYRESGGRGAGIMKSLDGGLTWNLLETTSAFFYVTDVVVRDENGSSVVYAGVSSGVYMGEVHNTTPANGLYRSIDGGETWEQVLPEFEGEVPPVSDIELGADNRMYVGTMNNVDGEKGSLIFTSDWGTFGSWAQYDDIADEIATNPSFNMTGRVKIAAAPSDANVVYSFFAVGTADQLTQGFPVWHGIYIMKSIDKGATWTEVNLPNGGGNQWAYLAWHALVGEVDPNNPDVVWAGGLDLHRTDDGGNTWTKYSAWAMMYYGGGDDYVHADQHCIAYKPGNSDIAIYATDGGVFYTNNAAGSTTFSDHNKDYNTLQFYSGKISPFEGNVGTLGGLQDNGSLLFDGSPLSPNVMVSGGDGGYCYFDPYRENAYISSVYRNQLNVFENNSSYNYINDYESGTFTSPFAVNFATQKVYANAMMFTGEYEDNILIISDFYGTYSGQFYNVNTGSTVPYSYMSLSPYYEESDRLLVGTSDGKLFKIDVIGETFTTNEITGTEFPQGFISSINYAGGDDTTIITFSNYGVESLWLTVDGGSTWTGCDGNLPDIPVRFAIFHPENSKQVMIATETGVWETRNIYAENIEWTLDETLPYVRTDMLDIRVADNTVLAATHGRGQFTTTWQKADYSGIGNAVSQKVKISPNPAASNGLVNVLIPESGQFTVTITNTAGKVVERIEGTASQGESVQFIAKHSGIHVVSLELNNKQYVSKFIVK
ncbi:MAG: hypothetical protein C0599_10040 [Salinivirgaceae bacterium]|nr:MAG: hypothetical protein C0599_10040 [Salinivirgaceae bacterium]